MNEQEPTKYISRRMAIGLVGLLIGLIILTVAASCSRPSIQAGQAPPSLPPTPVALTDIERQRIAEDYIRQAGTYGWDTPVAEWTRSMQQFTQGTAVAFPLVGPSYARCLNDQCAYTVQSLRLVPDTDMEFVVTSTFTTRSQEDRFESVWNITVNSEGVVTGATSAGEG